MLEVWLSLRNIVHIKEWGEVRGIARACQVTRGAALVGNLGGDESPAWLVIEGAAYVSSGKWSEEGESEWFQWGTAVNSKVLRPALLLYILESFQKSN